MLRKYFGEVLPYLEVTKSEKAEEKIEVEMPELVGKTLNEAKNNLKELGLECETDAENLDTVITDQLPKKGIKIKEGTKVILYCD